MRTGRRKSGSLKIGEKVLRQKLSQEERRTRSHRLVVRGAVFESIVPEAKTMTDEEAAAFLRLALTSEEARAYLKKTHRGREKRIIPLEQRAHLYTLAGVCALPRAYLRTGNFPRAPIWRLCRNKGLHPLAPLTRLSLHTHKNSTPAVGVCTIFAGLVILSGR